MQPDQSQAHIPDPMHPLAEPTQPANSPTQSPTSSSANPTKVIQPLDPNLGQYVASNPTIVTPTNPTPINNTASTFDPTDSSFRVPTIETKPHLEDPPSRLSAQNKSLLALAILGLISTAFLAYSAVVLNNAIHSAQLQNKNIGSAMVSLDIIWATVVINALINIYFIFATSRHTVGLILKILLVLELINILGVATGLGSSTKALSLLLDGAYAIYIFVVINVISRPAII